MGGVAHGICDQIEENLAHPERIDLHAGHVARDIEEKLQALVMRRCAESAGNALDVIVLFGKYDATSTTAADAGIAAYNQFSGAMKDAIGSDAVTVPAIVPTDPGVASPDIIFSKTVGGKRTTVTLLLVDNPTTASAAFDGRYASLSTIADLIIYNGHSGLGADIGVLAQKPMAGRLPASQVTLDHHLSRIRLRQKTYRRGSGARRIAHGPRP